jgi:hypothetical protein
VTYFSPVILFIDMIITINTSYYEKGLLIKNRYSIAHHYIKTEFFIDFFAFLPVSIFLNKEKMEP